MAMQKMVRKAVTIISDFDTIKKLADPARREILRQVAIQPQTGTKLAQKLQLTKPTIGHHLKTLLKARLIRIERTEVGTHGILQKYYEPTSSLFIEDFEKVPSKLLLALSTSTYAYFLHLNMERLMGILSVFQLIEEIRGRSIEISPEQLEELAEEFATSVARIGKKYEKTESDISRETLSIKIYSEALKVIVTKSRWKKLFAGAVDLGLA